MEALKCAECAERIDPNDPVYSNEMLHQDLEDGNGEQTCAFCSEFCRDKWFAYYNQSPVKASEWEG